MTNSAYPGTCQYHNINISVVFQPAKVTAHWHKGTTLMIKFEESVIARDKAMDGR